MAFKVKDHFYLKAKKEKYLARSIYKLEEIDKKFKIFNKNQNVLDLGYYPGSWIQYAQSKISKGQYIVGVDLAPIQKSLVNDNILLFQHDAFDLEEIKEQFPCEKFEVILSDMAPKTSGIKNLDQQKSFDLVEKVFTELSTFLEKNGHLVMKVFDGHDVRTFLKENKNLFNKLDYFRPKSTRQTSKEFFVIGRGFKA